MKIELHSRSGCPFCTKAKHWFEANGIPVTHVAHEDWTERNQFYDSLGLRDPNRTVPQIIVETADGKRKRIGGYTDLIRSDLREQWVAHKNVSFGEEF